MAYGLWIPVLVARWSFLLGCFVCLSSPAWAQPVPQSCSSGQAPSAYSSLTCAFNCSTSGSGTYTISCLSLRYAVAVEDYAQTGGRNYTVWGVNDSWVPFCCYTNDSSHVVDEIIIWGTSGADELLLSYDGRNVVSPVPIVYGWGGDDDILGSNSASTTDYLYGGDGDDEIVAQAGADVINGDGGDDVIEGGGGADTIFCGGGADTAYGGDGADLIEGEAGDDILYGNGGADILRGGSGNDELYGGGGADVLCGGGPSGAGADYLHATEPFLVEWPNDVDWLWSPQSANTPTGGGAVTGDECGHSSHGSGWAGSVCDYGNSTRPPECYE